jgi:hypothetical protein
MKVLLASDGPWDQFLSNRYFESMGWDLGGILDGNPNPS